jgi:hypothetical protein
MVRGREPQPTLDVGHGTAAVGGELPEQRLIERMLDEIGVARDGGLEGRAAGLQPLLAVEGVHGGEVEPVQRLGVAGARPLGRVLEQGEGDVVAALGERAVRGLEFRQR